MSFASKAPKRAVHSVFLGQEQVYDLEDHFDNISGWWCTYPSEKYESVGMIIPNIWKNKTCSKPPTRY